jgi:hypothetical protein
MLSLTRFFEVLDRWEAELLDGDRVPTAAELELIEAAHDIWCECRPRRAEPRVCDECAAAWLEAHRADLENKEAAEAFVRSVINH